MSGKICAVSSCKNFELLKLSKSFFRFPRDKTLCGQWVRKCMRNDLEAIYKEVGTAYFNNTYRICSDHFKSTDFRNPQLYSQGLKPNTVPSQNLPSSIVQGSLGSRRGNSRKRKREEEVEHNGTSPSSSSAREQPTDCLPDAGVSNEVKFKKEPMIQELLTEIPNELKHSQEMDAPPHPLCSVTIKGEPDETDMDLPFKILLKTEEVDCKETILQEMVPEFPMELKYSPPVDLSAQPFCSVTVKSEPEELDTDLSFKTLPRLEVDDLKTEMPDDDIDDGNGSNGTFPNCASYSLPSSTGGVREIPPIGNLCTSKDEAIAPYLCTLCQSRFRKECQLRSHLHSHHQPDDDGFSCFVCNKMYVKRAEFMRHVLELHPRLCPVCSETFHSWWDLHEHLSKYSELDSYSSPRCSQVYPTSTALEQPVHIYIFKALG